MKIDANESQNRTENVLFGGNFIQKPSCAGVTYVWNTARGRKKHICTYQHSTTVNSVGILYQGKRKTTMPC